MARHGLTDEGWALLYPLLPDEAEKRVGRPWLPHRRMIDAIFWILVAGAPWRDLPEVFGPWITVYRRFARWQLDGTWGRIMETLQFKLDDQGKLDGDLWCIDGTIARATRAAAGAPKKVATLRNPKITDSAIPKEVSPPRSTSSRTATAFRSPSSLPRANGTKAPSSKRPSTLSRSDQEQSKPARTRIGPRG